MAKIKVVLQRDYWTEGEDENGEPCSVRNFAGTFLEVDQANLAKVINSGIAALVDEQPSPAPRDAKEDA